MIETKELDPVVISAQPGYLVSNIEGGHISLGASGRLDRSASPGIVG